MANEFEQKNAPSAQVQITPDDMFRFNIYHSYTHTNGWIALAIGVIAFIMAGIAYNEVGMTSSTVLYIILGFVLVVYQPIMLKQASKRQIASSEVLQKPLTYTFLDEGIEIYTEISGLDETGKDSTDAEPVDSEPAEAEEVTEASEPEAEEVTETTEPEAKQDTRPGSAAVLSWEQVYKVVKSKHQLLIYAGRANAYILPLEQVGDAITAIEAVLTDKLPKFRRKGF